MSSSNFSSEAKSVNAVASSAGSQIPSQLVISYEGIDITFEFHELVALTDYVAKNFLVESVNVPIPKDTINFIDRGIRILRGQKSEVEFFYKHIGTCSYLPTVNKLNTTGKWLSAAKQTVNENKACKNRRGFWLSIGDRFILKRAQDAYVSDHGNEINFFETRLSIGFELNQEKTKKLHDSLCEVERFIAKKLNGNDEEKKSMANFIAEFEKKVDQPYVGFIEQMGRYKEALKEKLKDYDFLSDLPGFERLMGDLKDSIGLEGVDFIRNFFVYHCQYLKILRGEITPMFRVDAFGPGDKGASYQTFEKVIAKYLQAQKNPDASIELIKMMRFLLYGKKILVPDFLPALLVCWFIAEPGRHCSAFLVGLMLCDLMEINHKRTNGMSYTWQNVLIHPKIGQKGLKVKDFYGANKKPDEIGGFHSMAHDGSYTQAIKEDKEGGLEKLDTLTVMRQKEGAIILDWLMIALQRFYPKLKIILHADSVLKKSPNYDEVYYEKNLIKLDQIQNQIKKLEKTIQVKQKTDNKADVSKEQNKLATLQQQQVYLQKKQKIQKEILLPLLQKRMSIFCNLLTLVTYSLNEVRDYEKDEKEKYVDDLRDEIYKKEIEASRKDCEAKGIIGPKQLPNWYFQDVNAIDNCFYEAVVHQFKLIHHPFIVGVPVGTELHDALRLLIQGKNF